MDMLINCDRLLTLIYMKAILLILGVLVGSTFAVLCPKNRLEFFSHFSLGKQDELNRTFDSIAKNLTFP